MTLCVSGTEVNDPIAGPVLVDVLDAAVGLYEQLEERGVIGPAVAGILGGAAAAVDRGLEVSSDPDRAGQLWVRLVNLYPSTRFPEQDGAPVGDRDLSWAVVVEVGVVRPAPQVVDTPDGVVLPSMLEEHEAAALASVDAAVIRQALLVEYAQAGDVGIVLGQFTPFGPEGGVIGGATTATIQVV